MLEVAALLVLVVDLAFLRKAELRVRAPSRRHCLVCWAAALRSGRSTGHLRPIPAGDSSNADANGVHAVLAEYRLRRRAQAGILVLTALTLLLLIDSTFTRHVGEFVAVVLMSATGGLLIAGAQDLLVIFIGLELLSLGLYILTAFAKQSGRSAESAMKYYLFGGMSAAFLLFGFSYLYGISGSTNLDEVMQAIHHSNGPSADPLLLVAMVMIAAGLGFKVAAVPFHLWAPDAYEGAPAPAAAFIASVSKVASFALLISIGMAGLRVSIGSSNSAPTKGSAVRGPWCLQSCRWPRCWSATSPRWRKSAFGGCWRIQPLRMPDTCCWRWPCWILAFERGIARAAVLYYILTYGLTTVGAFGVVGVVERVTGSDRMDAFLGLHKRNPLLARCCWCCSCRSPGFRLWSASGPSSICLRWCWAWARAAFRLRW